MGFNKRFTKAVTGAVAAVAAVTAVLGINAGAAHAVTISNSGCPGTIQDPLNYAQMAAYVPSPGYPVTNGPFFSFSARTAGRSPCYSTQSQVVKVRYRSWGYNFNTGKWEDAAEHWESGTMTPGQNITVRAYGAGENYGNVSVDVYAEWRTTSGTLIGSKYFNENSVSDYRCDSTCGVLTSQSIGAYVHFHNSYNSWYPT